MATKSRPQGMSEIESLLLKNEITYGDRWHPTPVHFFEKELSSGAFKGLSKEVRKNIAYSLQYLEFLQLELDEMDLHSIVTTQIRKSYIITAMGIIEAVFLHLVKSKGYAKKEEWQECSPIHTNVIREEEVDKKYIITPSIKLKTPIESEMDFEYLINKVQEKKLIKLSNNAFPYIKGLKRLRNKVHLQIVKHENDTDYTAISFYDLWLMKYILYVVLRNEVFEPDKTTCLSFIKPSNDQIKELKEHLQKLKKDKEDKKNGQTENAQSEQG